MAVWSVLILATRSTLEQTSSYTFYSNSSCVKHLAGWKTFNSLKLSLVHRTYVRLQQGWTWSSDYLTMACHVSMPKHCWCRKATVKKVPWEHGKCTVINWDKETKKLGALWTELIAHSVTIYTLRAEITNIYHQYSERLKKNPCSKKTCMAPIWFWKDISQSARWVEPQGPDSFDRLLCLGVGSLTKLPLKA